MNSFITWPSTDIESIKVIDGDTLKLKLQKFISVRLNRIDTPEKNQPKEWSEAKKYTQDKVQNAKEIKIIATQQGNFGRYLVEVFVDGSNLNNELVEKGYAKKYDKNKKRTKRSNSSAKQTDRKEESRDKRTKGTD